MQADYIDPDHTPTSNAPDASPTTGAAVETSSDGVDLSPVEPVPGFKMRTTDWAITMPDEDMNLPPASSAYYTTPEKVCGNDDRVPINNTLDFPYKCIAALYITDQNGKRWVGSGFFIGPKCVITAGHVVFPGRFPDRRWAREINVVPGQNRNIGPFGSQVSRRFCSVKGWTNTNGDGNPDYDYGAIILPDATLYNKIRAHFGYQVNNNPGTLNNSGYPADKPRGTQWFNAGPVSRISPRRFFYMIDTEGGQSGSPVWINSGSNRVSVGVHARGGCPNSAIRCVEDVARNWTDWRNK